MKQKIALLLFIMLIVSLLAVSTAAADGVVTVTENFQSAEVGSYSDNVYGVTTPASAMILEEEGNRWLKLSVPAGSTGTPMYHFIKNPPKTDETVTLTAKMKFSNFQVNESCTNPNGYPAQYNLVAKYTDPGTGSVKSYVLAYIYGNGIACETAGTKSDGTAIAKGNKFYTASTLDQWMSWKVTLDAASRKPKIELFDDTGTLLTDYESTDSVFGEGFPLVSLSIVEAAASNSNAAKQKYGDVEIDDVTAVYGTEESGSDISQQTVVENFETASVGDYTTNVVKSSASVFSASIVKEDGNQYLRLVMPAGTTGTPGYYLIPSRASDADKTTVSFRARFKDFTNTGAAWRGQFAIRANYYTGGDTSASTNKLLLFIRETGLLSQNAGINAQGASVSAGGSFYTGTMTDGQWYTIKLIFDKADGKPTCELYSEAGALLGSVKSTAALFESTDQLNHVFLYMPYASTTNGTIEIDDVTTIYETKIAAATYALTGEIGEHGSVTVNGEPFANGDSIQLAKDADIAVAITPEEGYEIDQVKLGETALVAAGTVNATMPGADTTLTVTFRAKPTEPTIAGDAAISFFREVNGVPTAFVYGKIGDYYNPSLDAECGMKVWIDGDKEHTLTLSSRVDESTPRKAQPGLGFAIQVYGSAITAENRYKFQPYVGTVLGDEQTLEFQQSE